MCLVCILIVFNVKTIIIATTFASKNYFVLFFFFYEKDVMNCLSRMDFGIAACYPLETN